MTKNLSGIIVSSFAAVFALVLFTDGALAQNIPYRPNVTLQVGESIILKGVRGNDCGAAPMWNHIAGRMPRSKLGRLSDGGRGVTDSGSCGKRVPARAVKFTAQRAGSERIVVFDDPISITVK